MQLPQCGKCHIIDRCLKHCQLQQTKPTTFLPPLYTALLCYKYSTASVTEKQASFIFCHFYQLSNYTNVTKKPTRYIFATFTSSQILPPNHRSRLNATKEAISDSHPLLYLIQNYDKYTSGNRIAIFRASINNWANLTLSGKAIKPFETFVSITFNLNQRIAGHVQMKVILGKDKWWWGSRCLTARWCFVGIWGKFLSLSPPHYIIGTPFNLTQMLIHWNLLLLHTGLNLTDINYRTLQCAVL